MDGTAWVAAAGAAFVGSHLLMSHPLRRPIVGAVGEGAFSALYSLVALAALVGLARAYRDAPAAAPLWEVGDGLWALATVGMLLASVLLAGSLAGNPALPGAAAAPARARGVYAVTRHPMMWSFALWAACHVLVYPVPANIVLALAVAVLALAGSALQDRKKGRLQPELWRGWEARTSFWPFAAVASGRAHLGGFGLPALAGGAALWLGASWAHMPLAGWAAGIWRWI